MATTTKAVGLAELTDLYYDCEEALGTLHCDEVLDDALSANDESNNNGDINAACIMSVLNTVPVIKCGEQPMSFFTAFDEVIKRTNDEFEKQYDMNKQLVSACMGLQRQVTELQNEVKNLKIEQRYTQSLFGHSRIVCAHCLAAPGVISDTGAYYCSATCKEAATTSPLFSDC